MTQVLKTIKDYKNIFENNPNNNLKNKSIGFVPTMGALHAGHIELFKKSLKENDITVGSIFVNPTQFNNATDLEKYPRTFEMDLKKLSDAGVDYLFNPDINEMYPDDYNYSLTEKSFSKILCGGFRPGHFDGVLTVVMKLFNIVKPTRAYFGEKDFQQLRLIEDMTKTFFMDIEIIRVPTVRDEFGLALSSRNSRLSENGLSIARVFAKIIQQQKSLEEIKNELLAHQIEVEYLDEHQGRRFAAVYIEGVRLIDNL